MNKETFNNHKKNLQKEFEEQLEKLYLRCANEIAIAKEGEFVRNSFGLIKIDSISYILTDDYVKPTYTGYSYIVKDGQPVKMNCESTSTLFDVHKVEFSNPEEFKLGYVVNKLRYRDGGSTTLVFDSGYNYTCNYELGSKLYGHWFHGGIENIYNRLYIIHDLDLINQLNEILNGQT